tara:strand:+ start:1004 stop:1156 length:153 start_codon:yes stop_codon:yes gene_type:complete
MISVATPRAIPIRENQAITDIKPSFLFELRYRKAMKRSKYGTTVKYFNKL